MHESDVDDRQAPSLRSSHAKLDPFLHAPPPGRWGFWHGDHARVTVELARTQGLGLQARPEVPLPTGFPPPVSEGAWWQLEADGRTFFIREDEHATFLSCYVYNATGR